MALPSETEGHSEELAALTDMTPGAFVAPMQRARSAPPGGFSNIFDNEQSMDMHTHPVSPWEQAEHAGNSMQPPPTSTSTSSSIGGPLSFANGVFSFDAPGLSSSTSAPPLALPTAVSSSASAGSSSTPMPEEITWSLLPDTL